MTRRRQLVIVALWIGLGSLGLTVTAPAGAQDVPIESEAISEDARLEAIERQLEALRAELGQTPPDPLSDDPESDATGILQTFFQSSHPKPSSTPPPYEPIRYPTISISGVFQADAIWFHQEDRNVAAVGDAEDVAGFRRARLGVRGQVAENVGYMIEFDFGFPGRPNFTNVYVELEELPVLGTFRIGQWKQPFSMEPATSFREILFMERSLPFAFYPFRQFGIGVFNTACDDRITWAVSGYRYPTNFFGNAWGDDGYGTAERITALPYFDEETHALVHVGIGHTHNSPSTGVLRFRTPPEVGFTPLDLNSSITPVPFFVDTGNIPASAYDALGGEFAAKWFNVLCQAELIGVWVNQQAGPGLAFSGGYAQASYVLTGESHSYSKQAAAFGRVIPEHPFGRGGCGAWEIATRWSFIDLNSRNIQGGRLHDWTVGLNWYLNGYTRFEFNYIRAMLDDPQTGDSAADIAGLRAQLDF